MERHKRQQKCNFACSLPVAKDLFTSLCAVNEGSPTVFSRPLPIFESPFQSPGGFICQFTAFISVGFESEQQKETESPAAGVLRCVTDEQDLSRRLYLYVLTVRRD